MAYPSDSPLDSATRPTRVRFVVLAWLCAAATIAYIHRSVIAVPADTIREELGLSKVDMGWVMSAFFIGYAVCQVPAGWLGDVRGSRRVLPLYCAVWSLSTAMMGLAGGYASLLASRVMNGVAQAGLFPCSAPARRTRLPSGSPRPDGRCRSVCWARLCRSALRSPPSA